MDWVGRIVAERRRGEARWLYRASLEAEAVEVSAEGLAAELAAGRASEKGWIWTPGLCRWIPAAQLEFVRERFCPAATPPPLPPLRSGSNPFRALLDHARAAVRQWRRLLGVWFLPAAQLLPGFASVLNRGWRLELVRRGPGADLPEGKYWPRYLANGAVLWGMSFLYLLPVTILLLLDSFSWLFEMVALVQYALGVILSADPATGLGSMLAEGGLDFLLKSGFLVFYPIATWPLYRVAMLRYAMTRRWRVFVPGPTNLRLTRRAYPLIMNAFVQNKVLWALYLPVSSLVAVTGIGAPVVLALFGPLRLITTAYFYRDLLDQLARLEPEAFGLQASTADAAEEEAAPLPTRAPALSPAAGSPWPWCLTRDHARPESVSVDDWATTLGTTIRAAAIGADGGSRVAVWVPGMWRWETPADTYAFLERFPEPTEALAGRAPIPEPAESFTAQLRPKRIWHDLRDLLGADEPEKPSGRRRDWLGLWKGRAGWIVALQFLPVIGSIVNRGWRLDLIRSGATRSLPHPSQVGRHLTEGTLLWFFYLLYLLPLFLLLAATDFAWVETAIRLSWWILTFAGSGNTLGQILGGGLLSFLLESVVYLGYPVVTWPLYQMAMLRYALQGEVRVFFQLPRNWLLGRGCLGQLARVYLWQKSLWGAYLLLSAMLLSTVVGALLVPALLTPLRLVASGLVSVRGLTRGPGMAGYFPE